MVAGLPGVRLVGARLELLAEGLRRDCRVPDPAGVGDAAAGRRGGVASRLCGTRARSPGKRVRVAAHRQGHRARRGLRPRCRRGRPPGGVGPRPDGTAAAADRCTGRFAVQRPLAPPRLGAARRKLRLARRARGRHGHHGGPADRGCAAAAAEPDPAPEPAARQALRVTAGRQPALPERGERAAGRAGAARALRTAARHPGGRRHIEGRTAARAAG